MKKLLNTAAFAAVMGLGALVITTGSANARIVCNYEGDCWHTDHRYHYGVRVIVHPDDWYFHNDWERDHDRRWREYHEGRGYWHNGVWITF